MSGLQVQLIVALGLYRIDLGAEIESLRFAYAKDTYLSGVTGYATSVDFIGNSNQ
jgi:hypothetical protein